MASSLYIHIHIGRLTIYVVPTIHLFSKFKKTNVSFILFFVFVSHALRCEATLTQLFNIKMKISLTASAHTNEIKYEKNEKKNANQIQKVALNRGKRY